MVNQPTSLDEHRGMAAQKATELRRLRADVAADQAALKARQDELEAMLEGVPASTWAEAAEKASYLLGLFAETPAALDPRRQRLIAEVLADFDFLLGEPPPTSRSSTQEHEPPRTPRSSSHEQT